MVRKTVFLLFALPILTSAQVDYHVVRNYPNINRPIQIHLAPKVDIYDLGGLLGIVANAQIDIKNKLSLQATFGTRVLQLANYAYIPRAANSYLPERFISYSDMGVTWYFFERVRTREINLSFSRVNSNYTDVKIPALISKSWGLRFGNTGYQHWVQVNSDHFYAINQEIQNDTNDLKLGESFTYQNGSMFYAGIDFRRILNAVYIVDGKRKVSVRTITNFYLDVLYSTSITYNDIVTVSDNKMWKLNLKEEKYQKAGILAGCSMRKPQGTGAFTRIELGLMPMRGPYLPAFISFTIGWGFGIKSKILTQNPPE